MQNAPPGGLAGTVQNGRSVRSATQQVSTGRPDLSGDGQPDGADATADCNGLLNQPRSHPSTSWGLSKLDEGVGLRAAPSSVVQQHFNSMSEAVPVHGSAARQRGRTVAVRRQRRKIP